MLRIAGKKGKKRGGIVSDCSLRGGSLPKRGGGYEKVRALCAIKKGGGGFGPCCKRDEKKTNFNEGKKNDCHHHSTIAITIRVRKRGGGRKFPPI